ncbi:MAG TPA: DUF2585 family protein [Candidatus Polarisedimenticolia bacterium]|jgi:hypothetical protein|nr:DUF2585 family protein [Candidatus Polarisedimenticolia bacterium]
MSSFYQVSVIKAHATGWPETGLRRALSFLRSHRWIVLGAIAVLVLTAAVETSMGRSPLGPDGRFGWWDGDIWSSGNSQRVMDVYSFSHIVHGILFFAGLWLVAPRLPLRRRLLIALLLAAGWEILENSRPVIERYRAGTIAQGYIGDSILNSCSDILMMALGFLCASRMRLRTSVAAIVVLELFCLFWVRENLTLSVLRVLHPIPVVQAWQSARHVVP